MEKGKFARHVFINLGTLKLQMNAQISWQVEGPMPKNMVTILTKLTTRV